MLHLLWMRFVFYRPRHITLGALIITAVIASGALSLQYRGDYQIFFEPDNQQLQQFKGMQQVFSKNDNVAFVIASAHSDMFDIESLTLIKELTEAAWMLPLSSRVDSITNYQHTQVLDDDLLVEDLLLEITGLNQQKAKFIESVAMSQPEILGRLISMDGRVAVVNVSVNLPDGDHTREVLQIAEASRQLVDTMKQRYPNHEFYLSGLVMMNNEFVESAISDAITLIPLMLLVIVLVLLYLLRSVTHTLIALAVVSLATLFAMGMAGWLGIPLTMATVNVPIVVLTIGIADAVHLFSNYRTARLADKLPPFAVVESVQRNATPIIITSVTTAIGFLTLNFSAVPPLADFGNLTAIGVLVAGALSLTLLPSLLLLFPQPLSPFSTLDKVNGHRLVAPLVKHRTTVVVSISALTIGLGYLSTTNHLNDVAIEYFSPSNEFRKHADFHQAQVSGMSNIDFVISTNTSSGINDPEVLRAIDAFKQWLEQQPEVDHVSSITDVFKRLNQNMNGGDDDFYRLPDDQQLAAQYLLLYELSLPYGLDLNNQVNLDKSATRLSVLMKNLGSKEYSEFEQRTTDFFASHYSDLPIYAASPHLMFAYIGEQNMQSIIRGSLFALVLISLLLAVVLKSVKLGLISLIPNLMPAMLGYGVWALIDGELNMALAVVMSLTLGIVVDDTVHFLAKYKTHRARSRLSKDAVADALSDVGAPIVVTSLVLIAGFLVLTLSSFTLNSEMGLLTAIVIFFAVVTDLLFLPAVLLKRQVAKKAEAVR